MSPRRPFGTTGLRVHCLVVCAFALLFAVWRVTGGNPATDMLEARLLDLRFQIRGPVAPPQSVAVVAVDERAVSELGWAPPPRGAIAEAVRRVLDAEPAAVGLDLLLLEQTAAGPALAAAIAGEDRIVLAAAITGSNRTSPSEWPPELEAALERSAIAVVIDAPDQDQIGPRPELLLPRPEIVAGASIGHANIALSRDRVARRIPLGLWIEGSAFLPAMPLEVARIAAGMQRGEFVLSPGRFLIFGGRRIETDRAGNVILNHYGGRQAVTTVSLVDVLGGQADPALFRNRAVFFGATAESLGDLFATPYSAEIPGAEILATLTANLLADELIRRDATIGTLGAVLAFLLATLLFAATQLQAPAFAFAAVGVIWAAAFAGLQLAFTEWRLWFDATTVIATLLFTTGWMGAQRLRAEKRVAATMTAERENLAGYVSPLLADQLARGATGELDRRTQNAAVMFVDVEGYTALSESLAPSDTAAFLRALHRLFERCAARHDGVITAFVGDGAMIVFGLPEPEPGDAASAIACGRMLLREAGSFDSKVTGGHRLALRITIHFGQVTAAILGGQRQAQVTVTGDTVNVASRLQEIAKDQQSPFVVSRSLLDAALSHDAEASTGLVPLPGQRIRGREGAIDVFMYGAEGEFISSIHPKMR